MNPLELAAVGALGAAGVGLVAVGGYMARRRRRRRAAEALLRDQDPPVRRIRVEFEEDPIVAALGIGREAGRQRRP
jgi:hypothetical protein